MGEHTRTAGNVLLDLELVGEAGVFINFVEYHLHYSVQFSASEGRRGNLVTEWKHFVCGISTLVLFLLVTSSPTIPPS